MPPTRKIQCSEITSQVALGPYRILSSLVYMYTRLDNILITSLAV